jgi:hypothetical protein
MQDLHILTLIPVTILAIAVGYIIYQIAKPKESSGSSQFVKTIGGTDVFLSGKKIGEVADLKFDFSDDPVDLKFIFTNKSRDGIFISRRELSKQNKLAKIQKSIKNRKTTSE